MSHLIVSLLTNVYEGFQDMQHWQNWYPVNVRHEYFSPQFPKYYVIQLWPAIFVAILITLARFYVINPTSAYVFTHFKASKVDIVKRATSSAITKVPSPVVALYRDHWEENARFTSKYQRRKIKEYKQRGVESKSILPADKIEMKLLLKERNEQFLSGNALKSLGSSFTDQQLHRWFAIFVNHEHFTVKLRKFQEVSFLFAVYLMITLYGCIVLFSKDYVWKSIHLVWENYPYQPALYDLYIYYVLAVGLYIHLTVFQFFDTKHKDFMVMFIHHIVTLNLLCFSWIIGFQRIGSLVLVVHDISDVFLQFAKMMHYLNFNNAKDTCFAIFALAFFLTRLVYYPGWIIYSSMFWVVPRYGLWFVNYFFNTLLCALLILHIIWFSIIIKMVFSFIRHGQVKQDYRSDTEEEDEEVEEEDVKQSASNGHRSALESNGHDNSHSTPLNNNLQSRKSRTKRVD